MKDRSFIELLEKAKSGDRAAWETLQNRFSKFAHRYASKILKDEDLAQDVVQESFWDLYRNVNKIRVLESFPVLLKRALVKHGDRILRKKENRNASWSDPIPSGDRERVHSDFWDRERDDRILRSLNRLEPEDRKLIELYYYKNFTLDEISKSQGKTLSFIKKRHSVLKDILREGIGECFRPEGRLRLLAA